MALSSSAKRIDRPGIPSSATSDGASMFRGTTPLRVLLGIDAATCLAFGAGLVVSNAMLARIAVAVIAVLEFLAMRRS